jgi:hypothetical protein
MFGLEGLKEKMETKGDVIVCPVIGCEAQVNKMTRRVLRSLDGYLEKGEGRREDFEQYLCKEHEIYITPTTFIYDDLKDNLLWYDAEDNALLGKIMEVKRVKAQLHHDDSEDAVTWNVFRFLERSKSLSEFLSKLCNPPVVNPEIIYWSYSQSQQSVWNELERTRAEFGESPQRSSEPDIIVKSDGALFFIEAKLKSSSQVDFNRSHTAEDKKERIRRYSKGDRFLKRPVGDIMDAGYYQLMRFWVIGSSIAERLNLEFYLINLVQSEKEEEVEREFKGYIKENQSRKFVRVTWEGIYEYILSSVLAGRDKDMITRYFKNKTIGYQNGKLQRAFSLL